MNQQNRTPLILIILALAAVCILLLGTATAGNRRPDPTGHARVGDADRTERPQARSIEACLRARLEERLPQPAGQAGMAAIVENPFFVDESVETVDVTAPVVEYVAPGR